jgi:sugar/nucleoside kinase (ribokinase family)
LRDDAVRDIFPDGRKFNLEIRFNMPDVVCVGILVADVFGDRIDALPRAGELALLNRYLLSVGGCAANTAVDLARVGRSTRVLGKVGKDIFGDYVLQDLERQGCDTSYVRRSETHPTAITFVANVKGEDRRFFHCFGANSDFSIADIDASALQGARALYVGGYFAMPAFQPQHLLKLFQEAKQLGLITALDVVIAAGSPCRLEEIGPVLSCTDLFLPNTDEAAILTGSKDPFEQAEILGRFNLQGTIVVTLGGEGAVARRGSQVLRAEAFKVDAIDGAGAGDAFDAGFLVGMMEGWPLEDSLRFASALGASCTRALGCSTSVFRYDEAVAFLAQNHLAIEKIKA